MLGSTRELRCIARARLARLEVLEMVVVYGLLAQTWLFERACSRNSTQLYSNEDFMFENLSRTENLSLKYRVERKVCSIENFESELSR